MYVSYGIGIRWRTGVVMAAVIRGCVIPEGTRGNITNLTWRIAPHREAHAAPSGPPGSVDDLLSLRLCSWNKKDFGSPSSHPSSDEDYQQVWTCLPYGRRGRGRGRVDIKGRSVTAGCHFCTRRPAVPQPCAAALVSVYTFLSISLACFTPTCWRGKVISIIVNWVRALGKLW